MTLVKVVSTFLSPTESTMRSNLLPVVSPPDLTSFLPYIRVPRLLHPSYSQTFLGPPRSFYGERGDPLSISTLSFLPVTTTTAPSVLSIVGVPSMSKTSLFPPWSLSDALKRLLREVQGLLCHLPELPLRLHSSEVFHIPLLRLLFLTSLRPEDTTARLS